MRYTAKNFSKLVLGLACSLALSSCGQSKKGGDPVVPPVTPAAPEAPKAPTSEQTPETEKAPEPSGPVADVGGKKPAPLDPSAPAKPGPAKPDPVTSTPAKPADPQPTLGTPQWVYSAAPWRNRKGASVWTDTVVKIVRRRLADFERARDKEDFCPGYKLALQEERETCWLLLIAGVAKKESDFIATDSFEEGDGTYSHGLLSLSTGECANAPTVSDLHDPVRNLACGTNMMASLIARHGFVDGPESSRGAGAYWSTLRTPYSDAAGHSLGKKADIILITRSFRKPLIKPLP